MEVATGFVFGWPQLIMVCLLVLTLGVELAKNGEPKKGNHSFLASLIAVVINLGVLYWGGFFS